ncbi:MAG TPA: hypothetical protein VM933_00470 [Acidimicrobiales bacterium]|nr:hypothetical protein [Acidimicrobiales bacterium]
MKRFPRSRLPLALCVALGVATSGCVQADPPTVGMSKVEASLVFGVTKLPEPVATPVEQAIRQLTTIAQPPAPTAEEEEMEPQAPFEFAKPAVPRTAPLARREACPEAPVTAAALVPPQPRITGEPRPGTNRWREKGFVTMNDPITGVVGTFEVGGFNTRSIRNVVRTSPDEYSFEEVEVDGDDVTITTYSVNNAPVTANPSDGVGIVVTPSVGEPERGIVLTRLEVRDKRTGQTRENGLFVAAGAGLLMLPLPATAGETFSSTAVDPRTGQVISHQATVQERQRVDACGDLVDGWRVEYKRRAGQNHANSATAVLPEREIPYTTVWATQYGGVPIFDELEITADICDLCPLKLTRHLAQLEPDPLAS